MHILSFDRSSTRFCHLTGHAETLGQKITSEDTQINMENSMDSSISGLKRAHESTSSNSDKEQSAIQQPEEVSYIQLIVVAPKKWVWIEVKYKKKGKKGKLEEFDNP